MATNIRTSIVSNILTFYNSWLCLSQKSIELVENTNYVNKYVIELYKVASLAEIKDY